MGEASHRLLADLGRFLAVGGLATLVAFFGFNLLVHGWGAGAPMAAHPQLAYVLANTVGMAVSFHGSRTWAFRDRPTRHADGGVTAFVTINLVTMAIPLACLHVSRNVLGLDDPLSDNLAANVVGLGLGLAARFALFRTLVFRRPIALAEIYDEPPAGARLTAGPTDPSTSDPAGRPSSGAAAG